LISASPVTEALGIFSLLIRAAAAVRFRSEQHLLAPHKAARMRHRRTPC